MNINYGKGTTQYGQGVEINLSGDELAVAILAYLVANHINVQGPRTIFVNGELCESCRIYVDPTGWVETKNNYWSGRYKTTMKNEK
jgi:hypothetical protein